jgi:phage shock protein PspC (stress-responsive transcriptional regulator)
MSIADEISKLEELRNRGVLSAEEFERAKRRLLDGGSVPGTAPGVAAINNLRRSTSDSWIGGVCGGIARTTGVESWIWRLIFFVLFLFGGTGVLLYVLLWIFVPSE